MHAWQAGSAYLYILQLDRPALAWEYLRRNPDYRRQWHAGELWIEGRLRTRWGCAVPEDPNLDGREAQPGWTPDPPELVHVTETSANAEHDQDAFSVWSIPGRRQLLCTPTYVDLHATGQSSDIRLRMTHGVTEGRPYAYVVRADRWLADRWQSVCRHAERLRRAQPANRHTRTKRDTIGTSINVPSNAQASQPSS